MSESKHTPGPWKPDRGCVRDADGLAIASPTWADRSDEEIEANARLIAAAPAMYEALRSIADEKAGYRYRRDPIERANEVIDEMRRVAREALVLEA